MYPLSRSGWGAWLAMILSAGLLASTSAYAGNPQLNNPIPNLFVAEDSGPQSFDLDNVFSGETDPPITYSLRPTLPDANLVNVTISGTFLTVNFLPNRNGSTSVRVRSTDGDGDFDEDFFTISVSPVNDPPFIGVPIADQSVPENNPPLVIDLAPVFLDVDVATNGDVLTYALTSNSNLALVPSALVSGTTLTLTIAPASVGTATLSVRATDSAGAFTTDTFTVTVNNVDDIPLANDDSRVMNEDSGPIIIDVLANDQPGDSPTVIIQAGTAAGFSESAPVGVYDSTGTIVFLPNGSVTIVGSAVTYEPKANFAGNDHFTYTIEDANGQRSTATVNVTVNPVNDAPDAVASLNYSMTQGTVLNVLPAGGLVSYSFDYDFDPVGVGVMNFPVSGAALTVNADGSFTYTPDPAFVGTDQFEVIYSDGSLFSQIATVNVNVSPIPPPPPPPPAGEVEFDFDLANVPLEDAVSAEANVLIVMDDSGSMDWSVMVKMGDTDGRYLVSNVGWKLNGVSSRTEVYEYLFPLATNTTNGDAVPGHETAMADPELAGNNFGFWRARNSQFNPVYYNPRIHYEPWVGLNRNNVEFQDVDPLQAPLDPYDPVGAIRMCAPITATNCTHIDLTALVSYTSSVPRRNSTGRKNITTSNYYIPRYYTTTATGLPLHNDPNTLVLINAASAPFVGGPLRLDCALDDGDPLTCTYQQELQNFANWFSYYRNREYTAKAALGRTVADVSNIRLGYVTLNDRNERTRINSLNASYRVGHKKNMMDQIYSPDSVNGTPLRTALDEAGRHFECRSGDSFDSNSNTSPGHANCPILPAPEGICQQNFTLLFSDGLWNGGSASLGNRDHDGAGAFDGGRYADTRLDTLADVAMHYYERDLHGSLANGVPTMERDRLGAPLTAFGGNGETMHQHMKTYTVAFGLTGTIDPATVPINYATPFAWPDPNSDPFAKVDDMVHAAVNGRGEFLSANNPALLSAAFQNAFREFASGSVSVSAVAFNSTALREQTVEFRGFFNLKFNTGDLKALSVDASTGVVDELNPLWRAAEEMDSKTANSRVIVTYDKVNDTGVPFRFANLNANQTALLDVNELSFLRGDRSLEEPAGPYRQRPQIEGLLGDIVHSAPVFVGTPRAIRRDAAPFPTDDLYSAFKAANAGRTPIVYVSANDGMMHGFHANTGEELYAYVPNKLIDNTQRFKEELDQLTSLVYAHRFFVDLTPTVEDVYMPASKSSVTKSWNTVLIGGLRNGGKGYFALNVTDPNSDFTSEAQAAGTVLWEYTDVDDTYPVDSSGNPVGGFVGAQVDAAGQPVKDLGYTFSQPQVVQSNVDDGGSPTRKKWIAVFGNGYNSTHGYAKLFALFIEDGLNGWGANDFVKVDTGVGPPVAPDPEAGYPNGLGTPTIIDEDLNGTADLAFAGDLQGNLYRFDLRSSDPANWSATKLFQATYGSGASLKRQPITTQPYVFKHPTEGGFVVVFGTGSYMTEDDGTSTDVQSIYAIWDRGEVAPATAQSNAKATRLVEQVLTNVVDETQPDFARLRTLSSNAVVYTPDAGATPGTYGWYIDLDMPRAVTTLQGNPNADTSGNAPPAAQFPGERAIRRMVPRGDSLLITTVIPRDSNTCLRAPPGSIFPVDLLTGGNPQRPILDLNGDGVVDDNDLVDVGGVHLAAGILLDTSDLDGTIVDPSVLLGTGDSDFLFLSGGDDQMTLRVAGPVDPKTGRLSWREMEDAN